MPRTAVLDLTASSSSSSSSILVGEAQGDWEEASEGLHLISWNVAAWQTTLEVLGGDHAQVGAFFEKHKADVMCIQEVKVQRPTLVAEAVRLAARLDGWDSFWAPCAEKNANRKGMQGVATWARKGLTIRADAQVFGVKELDEMGRCLFTEHEEFCIFNVYAPAGANGVSMRMAFYTALRSAMQRKRRETNKPVILCGDLNLVASGADLYYRNCRIDVDAILEGSEPCVCGSDKPECCNVKHDLREWWPLITKALKSRFFKKENTTSTATKEKREKVRMYIRVPVASVERKALELKEVRVGKLRDSESSFEWSYNFDERLPGVGEIQELLEIVGGVKWDWRTILKLAQRCGKSWNHPQVLEWFHKQLLQEDDMVDSFRELHPNAVSRFTCWDQYTNCRYENVGARIDYFIVDRNFFKEHVARKDLPLRCGCDNPERHSSTHQAAKCAATAGGRFQPAAFTGGGLAEASQSANKSQFGPQHNGIIYTPPKYSDHVAVSLCVSLKHPKASKSCVLDITDKATKKAQPHQSQKQITSFFTKGTTTEDSFEKEKRPRKALLESPCKDKTKKKKGIHMFFPPSVSENNQLGKTQ